MIVCPLMSNPDVAREFNELKDATTSRAAYAIWSLNNGNMVDKAPNGEPSILFDALLSKFKNRFRAIREKAKYYTKSFFETFGDWINNPQELVGHLDQNGEPIVTNYNKEEIDSFLDTLIPIHKPLRRKGHTVFGANINNPVELIERFIYKLLGVYISFDGVSEKDIKEHVLFFILNLYYDKLSLTIKSIEDELSKHQYFPVDVYLKNMMLFLERENIDILNEYDSKTNKNIRKLFPKLFDHSPKVTTKSMFGYYKHALILKKGAEYDRIYNLLNEPNVKRLGLLSRLKKLNRIKYVLDTYPRVIRRIQNKLSNQIDRIFEELDYINKKQTPKQTLPSIDLLEKASNSVKEYFDYNSTIIEKGKVYSAKDILNYIKKNPQYKDLVQIILKSLETQGDIKIAGINDASATYGGLYSYDEDGGENAVYINVASKLYQSDPIHTILHELIHGITSYYLYQNPQVEKLIEKYVQYLIDNGVGSSFMGIREFYTPYGFKAKGKIDSHEFIAEFMTNKDFQELLKNIPAMEDSLFKSIFDSIVEWILNLLGIPKNSYEQFKPIANFVIQCQDVTINNMPSSPNIQAHGFDISGNLVGELSEFSQELNKQLIDYNNATLNIEKYAIKSAAEEVQKDSTIDPIEAVHKAKKEWIEQRQRQIIGETQLKLAEAYGLTLEVDEDGRIRFIKNGEDKTDLIIDFVDYLGEESGYYDHNSRSAAGHHTIVVALSNGDPSTFNHELAHHYVRMFWNSKLIQNALAAVYKEGMTDVEVEEALVDLITAKTTDSEFMSCVESQSFFLKFWGAFANMLYNTFHLENEAIKRLLCINAARAFAVNKEQKALDAEKRLFTMYQGRVFKKSPSYKERMRKKREALRTADSIVEYQEFGGDKTQRAIHRIAQGVVSRNKEFRKQSAISPSALVQMQTQEDLVKQFIQDIKDYRDKWLTSAGLSGKRRLKKKERFDMSHTPEEISRNIELIRDFIETALIELDDILRKLKASADSKYTLSIKREIVNPSTGEVEIEYLDNSHMGDPDVIVEEITFDELTSMYQNVIGFYGSALLELHEAVTDEEFSSVYGQDIKDELLNALSAASGVATTIPLMPIIRDVLTYYNHAVEYNTKFYVTRYVQDAMKDLPADYVERAVYSVVTWLNNQNVWGDSRALDSWLTLASHNKSTLVRLVLDVVDDINVKTHFESEKKAQTLDSLRDKAMHATRLHFLKLGKAYGTLSPFNFDKLFIEKDRNGKPTGNFASAVNKGQYYIDREDYINELLYGKNGYEKQIRIVSGDDKFELDIDDEGNPIFPEAYEDLEKQYRHDLNHWTAKHAIRAFREEYYDKKIDMLSKVTENAVDSIDKDIKRILYSCTIDGKIHTELLKPSKMEALQVLYYQKQQLANPFDRFGKEKPIGSEARQIADELTAWNNWVADNVAYKKDIEAYEAAKAGAKDPDAFERKNTYPIVNPEIWRELEKLRPKMTSDEIEKARMIRSKIKSRVKGKGIKYPSLDLVWDASTKNIRAGYEDFWKNLKQADEEYYSLIYQIKQRLGIKEPSKAEKAKVAKLIGTIPAKRRMENGTMKNWVEFIETQVDERVEAANPSDPFIKQKKEEAKKFMRVEVKDEKGDVVELKYLSIFDIYKAPTANVIIDGKSVPGIIHEPILAYSVIDPENSNPAFIDTRFNFESDDFVQPITDDTKTPGSDEVSYTNHSFIDNVQNGPKELGNYYRALLNTMKLSYENIPFAGKHDGRLVQRGAYTGQLYLRDILTNGLFGTIGAAVGAAAGSVIPVVGTTIGGAIGALAGASIKPLMYWLGRTFYINESDNDINIDFQLRPDGSRSMNIPVRYIKRLENQSNVNTDILGTVIEFYQMSLNYKYKSEKLPIVLSIVHNVSNSNTGRTGQLNALKGIVNRQFYERMRVLDFGEDNKVSYKSGWQKTLLKFLPFLRSLSTVGLLALNWISAIVAWLDPATQVLTEAIAGKQYNMGDYIMTFPKLIWSLPGAALSVGNVKHTNFLGMGYTTGAIDHFGLGRNVSSIYSHMDRSQGLSRLALEDVVMRPFSLGEYTVNALIVELVLGRYKAFKDLKTGELRFMHKKEYLQHAYDNGLSINQARRNWYTNFDTLRKAYHIDKKGRFKPKQNQLGALITDDFENVIAKEMRSKSTIANLIVPSTERTGWQTNIMVAFTTVMRTFLLVAISERAKSLHDFLIEDESTVDEMRISDTQKRLSEDYWMDLGGFNFQTRTIDDGIWKGVWHYLSHTRYFKYSWWRLRHPFRSTVDDKVKDKKEELQISDTDLYAMDRFITEVGLFMLIATISILFHNKMIDDGDDDKYGYQLIDHLLMRWAIVRMTFFSPDTVFDIITSVSASITDIENKLTVFQLLSELYTGLNEHGFNIDDWDKVKGQSAYKGKPKAFRSLLKTLSGLGLHAMYSSSNIEGIKSKTKWYLRLAYWRFLLHKNEKKPTAKKDKSWKSDYQSDGYKKEKYNSDWQ